MLHHKVDKTECTDYHTYFEIYYVYDCTHQIAKPFIVKGKKKALGMFETLQKN